MRWFARAVDVMVLGALVPMLLLPVAVAGGTILFGALSSRPCRSPCEGPGQLAMLLWGLLVLVAWSAYRPLLRHFGWRSVGRRLADSIHSARRTTW